MEESMRNDRGENSSSQGMARVAGMRKLTRIGCLRKQTDQILCSDPEKLLRFLTELKKHGDSIVEPEYLSEVIEALNNDGTDDDFKGVLNSILEVLVLPGKIALVLKYYGAWQYIEISDDVDAIAVAELTRSDYGILRQGILNPSKGAQEAQHRQGDRVSQTGNAPSTKKHPKRTKQ